MLNDICEQKCGGCMEYSRQFICCGKGKGIHSIDREILSGLFAQLAHFPSCNINIIGGDIYRYESLELLGDVGVNGINSINVYTHYLNYRVNPYIDKYQVHLMVNYPVNEARLEDVVSQVRGRSVCYHLIVEDDFQFQELERLMLHLGVVILKYILFTMAVTLRSLRTMFTLWKRISLSVLYLCGRFSVIKK